MQHQNFLNFFEQKFFNCIDNECQSLAEKYKGSGFVGSLRPDLVLLKVHLCCKSVKKRIRILAHEKYVSFSLNFIFLLHF